MCALSITQQKIEKMVLYLNLCLKSYYQNHLIKFPTVFGTDSYYSGAATDFNRTLFTVHFDITPYSFTSIHVQGPAFSGTHTIYQ